MKNNFRIYYDGEEFPEKNVRALERAMDGFVRSDVPLAVELVFTDEAEIRRLNRELREMISAGATQEELTAAARRNQGMTSLREAALQLVREGETTPEELLKITFYEE